MTTSFFFDLLVAVAFGSKTAGLPQPKSFAQIGLILFTTEIFVLTIAKEKNFHRFRAKLQNKTN